MRWPSDNLIEQLKKLKLCSKADVEACEPIVRRLCHDLPDFDSVWLDALVQRRTLTPWQAARLQSNNPDAIVVDDIRLRDEIGAHTFVGDSPDRTVTVRRIVARHQQTVAKQKEMLERRLDEIDEVRGSAPASICLPHHIIEADDQRLHLVSRFIAGWTADELITRGGRLPWQAVAEIGRQLLQALDWLDSKGWTHAEIALRNVRISSAGNTTLVAPFVQQFQQPTVSITSAQTLKDVETTAPELVGSGRTADARSELYALGCVLWQLLTARSPFPSADPVGRLQQGQLREITNVRQLVPECPEWLATQLFSLTRRSPALRPSSISIAAKEWAAYAGTGTSATRRLLKRLPDRSQRQRVVRSQKRTIRNHLSKIAVVAAMIPLFGFYAWQRGLLPNTLALKRTPPIQQTAEVQTAAVVEEASPVETEPSVLALPAPDAAGVVSLRSGKQYLASDLKFAGVMHIETDGPGLATINVADQSWTLQASHVDISNVEIRTTTAPGMTDKQAFCVRVTSDVFSLRNCTVNNQAGDANGAGVFWNAAGTTDGVVTAENCVFRGLGYGIWLQGTPSRFELDNVLLQQQAGGIRMDALQSPVRLNLSRVTQVGGNSFVDLVPRDDYKAAMMVRVQCGESVLAPTAGLLRIATTESMQRKNIQVEFLLPERGNATIIPPGVDPVLCFDRSLKQFVKLDQTQVVSESLLIARPVFRGADSMGGSNANEHFELLDYEGPKLSPHMPGISLSELPTTPSKEVNN